MNEWTGKVSVPDMPGAGNTFAQSINNQNQVAGYHDNGIATGAYHGSVSSSAGVTTMDFLGVVDTELLGLNDLGILLALTGDATEARRQLLEIVRAQPTCTQAREALAALTPMTTVAP